MAVMVSVWMITYNHEEFIAQAIESVLMQQTNFEFEIVIGEDCSTDRTLSICKDYQKKYPDKIRLITSPGNVGIAANGSRTLMACKGKYVALLEGDDYWTDPTKLQRQVDILESNPGCVVCHHWQKLAMRGQTGQFVEMEYKKEGQGYYDDEVSDVGAIFSFKMRIQTRSVLFRNIFLHHPLPDWFNKVKFGDFTLYLILAKYGKFYFMKNAEMAVYRLTGDGASSIFNNHKGFITGNKAWLEIWAYGLDFHNYEHEREAVNGMKLFISRIKSKTNDSFFERIKLVAFVLTKMKMKFILKKELIKPIMKKSDLIKKEKSLAVMLSKNNVFKNKLYSIVLKVLRRNDKDIYYLLKKLSPEIQKDPDPYVALINDINESTEAYVKFKPREKDKNLWLQQMNINSILDIGAAYGDSVNLFHSLFPKALIHSFEPLHASFMRLKALEKTVPGLKTFNFALGDKPAKMTMNRNDFSPSSSLLKMNALHKEVFPFTEGENEEEIEVKTLDSLSGEINLVSNVLMKIDVQGFEENVIRGAVETLKKVKVIIVELSFVELYSGQPMFEKIYGLLKESGFVYCGSWHQLLNPKDGRILQQNGIFINTKID